MVRARNKPEGIAVIPEVLLNFVEEYMSGPFGEYVNGASLQRADFLSREYPFIRESCRPDELCLYIFLEKPLPEGINLPIEFEGYPVFSKVHGPIDDDQGYVPGFTD